MTDEQLQSRLEEGFRRMDTTPEDVDHSTRQVMERTARVRQRSRWWPFPIRHPRPRPSTASDSIEDLPSPIPAIDGHTPTVIGRTQTMFSPLKAMTAAALVFGVGGALVIAQGFGEQGRIVPGAATEGTRRAPVAFTGHFQCGPLLREGTSVTEALPGGEGSVTKGRGGRAHRQTATMSDPRLEGDVYYSQNADEYHLPGPDENRETMIVEHHTRRIVNDDGAWQGTSVSLVAPAESATGRPVGTNKHVDTYLLIGEDGYEGLSAVYDAVWDGACGFDVTGIIFEGDLPPAEPFMGEQ